MKILSPNEVVRKLQSLRDPKGQADGLDEKLLIPNTEDLAEEIRDVCASYGEHIKKDRSETVIQDEDGERKELSF